jgi:hypothetical protein
MRAVERALTRHDILSWWRIVGQVPLRPITVLEKLPIMPGLSSSSILTDFPT